ncbi:sporulation protein [Hazenella coriacea]|uniref:Sporulation-control protein n=1 Tax=Hazenella coriacea TaxID=1179467 RepID=A0A4R3L7S2_9BACL|nr:sporulation protein [Hazenella coriacea]TCS95833.1 sporulation-control protein [Hazenella coriacea]
MFKSFLASLGVGAATIDLILDRDVLTMGEAVTGRVVLKGGDVEQLIEGLSVEFRLASSYKKDDSYINVNETIQTVQITNQDFMVYPGEEKEFPFYMVCPALLPVSSVNTRYYFQTDLEIKRGLDAEDRDFVEVRPVGIQKNFLEGFRALGLVHQEEGYTGRQNRGYQIIQFRPTEWLAGEFDELVFMYQPEDSSNHVSGYYELDLKTRGLIGFLADELDLNEKKGRFMFAAQQLMTIEDATFHIQEFINKNMKGLITG